MFKIDILQEQFKPYQAYFKSETTQKEFEKAFKDDVAPSLIKVLNTRIGAGIHIPWGWDGISGQSYSSKVKYNMNKDMLFISETGKVHRHLDHKLRMKNQGNTSEQYNEAKFPIVFEFSNNDTKRSIEQRLE